MKTWQTLKRWLNGGCVYFTVISLFFLLLNLATPEKSITPVSFLRIVPAALTISLGGLLLKWQVIPRWARCLAHYALLMLAFFLFLWMPFVKTVYARPSTTLIVIVILSVVYWLIFLLVHLIGARIRRLMEED